MFRTLTLWLLTCAAALGLTPGQVVVVYNADSPLSVRTARHYCEGRRIPSTQMVALRGVKGGDISRSDFEHKVRNPLMYAAACNDWRWPLQNRGASRTMYAMVLMPDLPLRVQETPSVIERRRSRAAAQKAAGHKENVEWTPDEAAAVDSELMLLGANYSLHSALDNPCYGQDTPLDKAKTPVLAVCRIDGPDETCIRRMTDDPLRVEREGLWGWVVVDEGGPYPQGERMFRLAAEYAQQQRLPLLHESSKKTLALSFPLMAQTAVYFGWYNHKASGPFSPKAQGNFRFAPGAVAGHLHSFSCTDLKAPDQWAPALLQRGAAVTFGNVHEPFLGGCHDFGVFYDRLLKGYTVAEAAAMSIPMISWQEVVFGDPLYRPFAAQSQGHRADNPFAEWQRLMQSVNGRPESMETHVRAHLGKADGALFAEAFGYLCADNKKFSKAADYFRMAANASAAPADKLRNTLMQATALHLAGDKSTARSLMLRLTEESTRSPHRPAIEATAEIIIPQEWAEMKKRQETAGK